MSTERTIVEAPKAAEESWDDRAARVVESFEAWRAQPYDFQRHEAFLFVMSEHVRELRKELRADGWESA